ncbi:hypothetical protein TSUD_198220 [Trifolium subterraneum]|uniref:Uncharacterized protein n=1 Tax=Trifolium subterraneum TaxID=3900 RepID=A0A2Z6NVN9_TRISU|nr:hypothetical protein TSUD_198220 [Trifolium subterraneum]
MVGCDIFSSPTSSPIGEPPPIRIHYQPRVSTTEAQVRDQGMLHAFHVSRTSSQPPLIEIVLQTD